MSKSQRTQQRYRHAWRNQSSLDTFGFRPLPLDLPTSTGSESGSGLIATQTTPDDASEPQVAVVSGRPRSATVLSDPSTDRSDVRSLEADSDESESITVESDHGIGVQYSVEALPVPEGTGLEDRTLLATDTAVADSEVELEDWEDELHEAVASGLTTSEIRDWETLRAQIQLDLRGSSAPSHFPKSINS